VLLDGAVLSDVAADLTILFIFMVGLFAMACLAFYVAFRHAKKAGTLAQY